MQSKCTRWNGAPAQCDRLVRCTRVHVHSIASISREAIKIAFKKRYHRSRWVLTEGETKGRKFSLVRRRITPTKPGKLHKYLERNSKATALIERSPHCTIRRTVSNRGANEHAGNRDSGIDSQHPCTYERIGPPIGKVSRSRKQALGVSLRQTCCQTRQFDLRSVKWTSV